MNNLHYYRQIKGLSQQGLAMIAGTSQSYIARLEEGKRPAGPLLRRRLSLALGVPESAIWPDSDAEEQKGK